MIYGVNMFKLFVLILSSNIAECVNPQFLSPIRQFGEACGYDACPVPMSADGINVHIVPHTHYELGFTRTFAEHYTGIDRFNRKTEVNMKRTLDTVVTELWGKPDRRFTISDFPYFFHWWSQRDNTVRQMVHTLIRQGRLSFVGGGWSMNDEATTSYHAIVDSFTYTLRKINATFWECGRPLVAWQADVLGHSREFASLVAQMGYDAMFINPISFDDELARMRRWALELVWRGSDDLGPPSDIFTHKLFDGVWAPPGFCFSVLCEDPLIVTSSATFSNVEQRAREFEDSIYNRQAPNYNSSHVLVIMGTTLGYFDASYWFSNIDALITAVNSRRGVQKKKKMYLMYSTPACYAKAVHDEGIKLETKQDDFYPVAFDKSSYVTGLYTSSPSVKLMAREVTVYLQMCKQMSVLASLGPCAYNKLLEQLNWIAGAFQDHTLIGGVVTDHVKSYYQERLHIAIQRSTMLLKAAWNKLRGCPATTTYYRCVFNTSSCHTVPGEYNFLHIYNSLAWTVTTPVRMPIEYFGEEIIVYDPKGNIVKSAIIKIPTPVLRIPSRHNPSNYEVVFRAEKIPPIGFKTYFMHRILPQRTKREGKADERARRTVVKHIRKPNKKYLIRQAQHPIESQTLLYDLDYDYEEATRKNPQTDRGNISLLFKNEADEEQLQQMTEFDSDKGLQRPEDIVTPTPAALHEVTKLVNLTPVDEKIDVKLFEEYTGNDIMKINNLDTSTKSEDIQRKMTTTQRTNQKEPITNALRVKGDIEYFASKPETKIKTWKKVAYNKINNTINEDRKPQRTTTTKYDNESRVPISIFHKDIFDDFNKEIQRKEKGANSTKTKTDPEEKKKTEMDFDIEDKKDEKALNLHKGTTNRFEDVESPTEMYNNIGRTREVLKSQKGETHRPVDFERPMKVDYENDFRRTGEGLKSQKGETNILTKTDLDSDFGKLGDNLKSQKGETDEPGTPEEAEKANIDFDIETRRVGEGQRIDGYDYAEENKPKRIDFQKEMKEMEESLATINNNRMGLNKEDQREQNKNLPLEQVEENKKDNSPLSKVFEESLGDGFEREEPLIEVTTENEQDIKVEIEVLDSESGRQEGQGETPSIKTFESKSVKSTFIENKYIRVVIDPVSNKITTVTLSNGVQINLDIQFYYYVSDDPAALGKSAKAPGSAIFRAVDNSPIPVIDRVEVEVFKTPVVEEAHVAYSDWASFVMRLYEGSPVIEVDWLVGPVPIDDKLGKEVFVRYTTDLIHAGVFYTDSNGRQTIKRIRNMRPMFESMNHDQVAGNFYPVTSKVSIEDLNSDLCFSVFPDRAQGVASLADGELDVMLQRRILTDDTTTGNVFVNDTEEGVGAVIRGKHYLYISKLNHKPYKIFEKIFAKERLLPPQVFVSHPNPYGRNSKEVWFKSKNEISFLKTKLPIGVHLLTLEHWNDETLLLRLENILEKNDTLRVPTKTVFVRELFTNIYINNVKETTLGANMWLEDSVKNRLKWQKKEDFVKSFGGFYGVDRDVEFLSNETMVKFESVDLAKGIKLAPQQIRTFVCWFDYVEV